VIVELRDFSGANEFLRACVGCQEILEFRAHFDLGIRRRETGVYTAPNTKVARPMRKNKKAARVAIRAAFQV
jgi:hypothetical protein